MSDAILEQKKSHEFAKNIFAGLSVPTLKNENFRYTSLRDIDLAALPEQVPNLESLDQIREAKEPGKILRSAKPFELLSVSGAENQDLLFTDILSALKNENQVLKNTLELTPVDVDADFFSLLNLSKWQNGFFVHVGKSKRTEIPLRALHYFDLDSKAFVSRTIIVVDEGAELTFTDEWASSVLPKATGARFYSGLVEVYAKKGSRVHYSSIQNLNESVQYFIRNRFVVEKDAELNISQVNLGGQKGQVRLDIEVVGEGARINVLGATRGQNDQHFDFWVNSNHSVPHTQSDLLYYTVMAGRSHSVFNGKITITEKAVQTDASQRNRNLLLSNEAVIHTIPKLEISTDDVKCAHGATVSSVSDEALYYLMSRGITKNDATQMIVDGFTEPVIERLPTDEMRERVRKIIQEKGL